MGKNDNLPYLVCKNPDCALAKKKLAYITDYGIGSVTDTVKCYECKHFFRTRSASQESRKSGKSSDYAYDSKKAKKGDGKGGKGKHSGKNTKGSNSLDKDNDSEFWKSKFQLALSTAKDNGGMLDVATLEELSKPPTPPVVVPGVSDLSKLKKQIEHNQKLRQAKHNRLVENIDEFKQIRADLTKFDNMINDLNNQFKQMILDSKIVEVGAPDNTYMDTEDHVTVPNDVTLWDDELVLAVKNKLLEHQQYQVQVNSSLVTYDLETSPSQQPSFSKAAKGSGRNTPYEKIEAGKDDDNDDFDVFPDDYNQDMMTAHLEEASLLADLSAATGAENMAPLG